MTRPQKYDTEGILEKAGMLVARDGPASTTMAAIASAAKVPNGSIYHRFGSRDALMGRLWLSKAAYFQERFVAALEITDPRAAALAGALSVSKAVLDDPIAARIMLLHRREDFSHSSWPVEMAREATRLGTQLGLAFNMMTTRLFGEDIPESRAVTRFLLADLPYAAVKPYIEKGEAPPVFVDAMIEASLMASLDASLKAMGRSQ
ncbi:TetR/AcrR family transcriptional regulator [Sphingomonas sp. UYAg733]